MISREPAPFEVWMELVVASVEQRVVKGTAKLLSGKCAGGYVVHGNYANNRLAMKATDGPCPIGFTATKEGNKLIGTTGAGAPLQLSLEAEPGPSAPHPLVGRYRGSMRVYEPLHVYAGLDLIITSVNELGFVKGKATSYARRPCTGDFDMRGRYQNKEVRMRTIEGPCAIGLDLKDEGNRLVGTTGRGEPVELLRRVNP
jgi:hypothetical protein